MVNREDDDCDPKKLTNAALAHLLLWTPWDRRMSDGLKAYTNFQSKLKFHEKIFIQKCFVKPDPDSTGTSVYDRFLSRLDSSGDSSVILTSYAGVGKSTLINAALIQKELEKTTLKIDIIEDSSCLIEENWNTWFSKNHGNFPLTLTHRIISLLLLKIYTILRIKPNSMESESEEDRKKHLKCVYENYNKLFWNKGGDPRLKKLFVYIQQYCDGKLEYNIDIDDFKNYSYSDYMKKEIFNIYTSFSLSHDFAKESMYIVEKLLEDLSTFALCESSDIKNSKRVIVFDNIEHFLNNTEVFDQEVYDLLRMIDGADGRGLNGFIRRMNDLYSTLRIPLRDDRKEDRFPFSDHFVIVLAVREFNFVYAPIFTADTVAGVENKFIRMEDSYLSIDEILNKKIEFLKKLFPNIAKRKEIKVILDMLDKSKGKREELQIIKQISLMYSHNKRSVIMALVSALAYKRKDSDNDRKLRQDEINNYLMLSKESKKIEDQNVRDAYINGARQAIYRLLFDHIAFNMDNYKVNHKNSLLEKLALTDTTDSFASVHQILTILNRYSQNNDKHHQESIMRISDLMRMLFLQPHKNDENNLKKFSNSDNNELRKFAQRLDIMRSRNVKLRWRPFILLVLREPGEFDADKIYNQLKKICDDPKCEFDDNNKLICGIKITVAGEAFLNISPTYEFFSARYNPVSHTLFDNRYLKDIRKGISHIEKVKFKALECIDSIEENVKSFVKHADTYHYNSLYSEKERNKYYLCKVITEFTQPESIIINHIGYIDNFRLFVTYNYLLSIQSFNNKIDIKKIAEERNIFRNDVLSYVNKILIKYHQNDNICQQKITEVVEISIKLLNIINDYINRLKKLTSLSSGNNPKQFFIGGHDRAREINLEDSWGDRKYGYKTYEKQLEYLWDYPLSLKSLFKVDS